MLNFFRAKTQPPQTKTERRDQFTQSFYSAPHHQWIREDHYLLRGVQLFLDALTDQDLEVLIRKKKKLLLSPATGRFSCAFNGSSTFEVILLFPELIEILRSASPERGVAILLHEAGHLIRQHSHRSLNQIEAQLEADRFCVERGYGQALEVFLRDQTINEEIDLRLRYLGTLML